MSNRIRRHTLSLLVFVTAGIFLCGTSGAQETSAITGTVTDPSGAVVANAKVTVILQETGSTQSTTTNGSGLYEIPGLDVCHYTMNVSAPGFTTYQKTGIIVNVAQTLREDVPLAVGANSQTVTVQAAA